MPNWWLVSWTTYGTWLPGDKRGYCTWRRKEYVPPPKRYARPGEPTYQADGHTDVYERAKAITEKPIYFDAEQMKLALDTMIAEIADIAELCPAIMSLGTSHVHWLCHFGKLDSRPRESGRDTRTERTRLRRKTRLDERRQSAFETYPARMPHGVPIRSRSLEARMSHLRMED